MQAVNGIAVRASIEVGRATRMSIAVGDSAVSQFSPAVADRRGEQDLDDLLVHVARGDQGA
jgi:hypothetical protein